MVPAPGRAPKLPIKIQYTFTDFWLRLTLYRDAAPVNAFKSVTGDRFEAPLQIVPRPRLVQNFIVPGWQKPRHTLLAPVTDSWLKYQDIGRMLRRVTRPRGSLAPSLNPATGGILNARPYCRAVRLSNN